MTAVYSGGLVYEYSEEGSKYGLVKISGDSVSELDDYTSLKKAFSNNAIPSTDGGYKKSGGASECPTKSNTWNVNIASDKLPAFPDGAKELMDNGAGAGPGLQGKGSQTSGSKTTQLADAADGAVTSGAAAGANASKGAAASVFAPEFSFAPLVCGMVVVVSTLFGAALI